MQVDQTLEDYNLTSDDIQKLKSMVDEAVNTMYRMDSERELKKEIAKRAKDELGIPPKLMNKLVRVAYKQDGDKQNKELTSVLDLAEQLNYYHHSE